VEQPSIVIVDAPIDRAELRRLVDTFFQDMVKYVVDVERGIAADAEALLLESGSRPADLWGANYYPGQGRESCIEYTSLINIRPAHSNPSMEIVSAAVRERVRELTFTLIGEGEALA
jgi:hypothetical protein